MSIRIQNDQTAGAASNPAQRTEPSARFTSGGSKPRDGISGDGEDQVDVSSVTASIGSAVSAQNAARSARLQQLGALVAGGHYSPDSFRTGQAILSAALGGGAGKL